MESILGSFRAKGHQRLFCATLLAGRSASIIQLMTSGRRNATAKIIRAAPSPLPTGEKRVNGMPKVLFREKDRRHTFAARQCVTSMSYLIEFFAFYISRPISHGGQPRC